MSKGSENPGSDCLLIVSCMAILYFAWYPGIFDAIYAICYTGAVIWLRLRKFGRPFDVTILVVHLAITHSLISDFDKVLGYPDASPHIFAELCKFVSGLMIIVIGLAGSKRYRTWKPIAAMILMLLPLGVFPLEVGRNMTARLMYPEIPPVYVTKIDLRHIYGVSLDNRWIIVRFSISDGRYEQDFCNDIEGLGRGGSMDEQIPNIGFPAFGVVRLMYGYGRIHGKPCNRCPCR